MKKKYSIEDIENNKESIIPESNSEKPDKTEKSDKTPVYFKRKKKRNKKRIIISVIAVILLGIIGYFGWITWNSIRNIFAGGNAPSLLNLFDQKQLNGESSGRINVLLLGMGDSGHPGQDLTDTIMVVSYDVKSKQVAMMSIPRDLYAKIGSYGYSKINAANAYGEKYKYSGGGAQLAEDTVSKVLDIPIHYYARVDFTGFKDIIDAVGGVDINVEKDLYDPFYPKDNDSGLMVVSFKKGMQHMDGTHALWYARSRETTSDFDRARRQQQVLVAVKEKVMSSNTLLNPKKMSDIIQILGKHIKTDFQVAQAQHGIELAKGVDTSKIINRVFNDGPDGLLASQSSASTGYILIPRLGMDNFSALQQAAKNIFNEQNFKSEGAKVSVLNGTTKSGLATKASNQLTGSGLKVVNTGSASRTNYLSTVVYDYTNGAKPNTVKFLENYFDATVVKQDKPGNIDVEVILGRDYGG
jgi:LCP family protein required for cell wall assembly